ncbi:SidA/IucD/PvdA family monooxygenase, partial [Candidatus Bathyarchaeota archaeon]|nr:SidA/IucD/PvdA family monooxygenase [Candidatus Bathyarchaeota archaeon]
MVEAATHFSTIKPTRQGKQYEFLFKTVHSLGMMMQMKKKRVIIIGGDAAGLSAASSIRRSHEDWDIVVYEKGKYISYAACGIPYYVADLVQDENTMITITRETFLRKRNIPVKIFHEVLAVDTAAKEVHVENVKAREEFKDTYDILVIATGATPKLPSIPGIMHPRVFTVHGLDSGITIKQFIARNKPESVVLIGAGYINLEMVEACHAAGIPNITMIKRSSRVLPSFAEKISSLVKQELEKHGIPLIHGNPVTRLDSRDDGGVD